MSVAPALPLPPPLLDNLGAAQLPLTLVRGQGARAHPRARGADPLAEPALQPEIAILDETDSGLDIDALRIVSDGVNTLRGDDLGVLVITHYQRILEYIKPDFVHIMLDGRIVESGDADLALHLEEHGYDWIKQEVDAEA